MPVTPIDTAVLHSEHTAAYLAKKDSRWRGGFRAALEALAIPIPAHLERKAAGRKPGREIAKAYAADQHIHGDNAFYHDGSRRPPGLPRS